MNPDLTARLVGNLDKEGAISIAEIIQKFRVRWPLFALCVVLVPLAALLFASIVPPTYNASAELLIAHEGGGASFFKDLTAGPGGISGQSAAEMIRSGPICTKMVQELGVTDEDIARPAFKVLLGNCFKLFVSLAGHDKDEGRVDRQADEPRIAADLKDSIDASTLVVDRTIANASDEVVEVKLKSTNRSKVAGMVNGLCRIFIETYNQKAADDAMRAFDTLAQQAAKVQAEMTTLRSAAARPDPVGISPTNDESVAGSPGSLSRAKPLTEGMGNKISDIELRVIELERVYTASSPELARAKAELEQARVSLSRQEALDGAASLLDDIRSKQRQAMVTAALYHSNQSGLTIIENALTPKASKTALLMHYGIAAVAGGVLGVFLGIALVLAFSAFDDRLHASWNLAPAPGLAWLGNLPAPAGSQPPPLRQLPDAENLPALLRLRGKIEEAGGEGPKRILVTSAGGWNDRGRTALQLACLFARDPESRVLLVDAAFEDGALTGAMDLRDEPGLIEVLNGRGKAREFLGATALPNLKFLPVGDIADRASLGFIKKRWRQMQTELNEAFDFLVLHAPAAADTAEVPVLTHEVDQAVVVVRQDTTSLSALGRTVDLLRQLTVPLLGALLVGEFLGRKKARGAQR